MAASREDNRKVIEQHIHNVAIRLFCEIGYKKTTLVDIAAEADVSTRTLHKYYPTKESILRRFCRENIMDLKDYVNGLDPTIPLYDRVIDTMIKDYSLMFGLFDPGHILHYTRDPDGILNRFEVENILEMESIYCTLLKREQLAAGMEPDRNIQRCASTIASIYRHCNDIYRFCNVGRFSDMTLRAFYNEHLSVVWDSLYKTLMSGQAAPLDSELKKLYPGA